MKFTSILQFLSIVFMTTYAAAQHDDHYELYARNADLTEDLYARDLEHEELARAYLRSVLQRRWGTCSKCGRDCGVKLTHAHSDGALYFCSGL
jgi:hypothetical protein